MTASDHMRNLIDIVNESNLPAARKMPGSNFHKLLQLLKDNGSLQRHTAIQGLDISSESWSVLLVLGKYGLAENPQGESSVGAITPKGEKVLALLDAGKAVNIKTGEADEEYQATQNAKPEGLKYKSVKPLSSAASMLIVMAKDKSKSWTISSIANAGQSHQSDASRYLRAMEREGLVVNNGAGHKNAYQITDAGIEAAKQVESMTEAAKIRLKITRIKNELRDAKDRLEYYTDNEAPLRVLHFLATGYEYINALSSDSDFSLVKGGPKVLTRLKANYDKIANQSIEKIENTDWANDPIRGKSPEESAKTAADTVAMIKSHM